AAAHGSAAAATAIKTERPYIHVIVPARWSAAIPFFKSEPPRAEIPAGTHAGRCEATAAPRARARRRRHGRRALRGRRASRARRAVRRGHRLRFRPLRRLERRGVRRRAPREPGHTRTPAGDPRARPSYAAQADRVAVPDPPLA